MEIEIKNILEGWKNELVGLDTNSSIYKEAVRKLSICDNCVFKTNGIIKKCGACGCPLAPKAKSNSNCPKGAWELKMFLGGTYSEYNWRKELIPNLKLKYFNPIIKKSEWDEAAREKEIIEKIKSDIHLYVVNVREHKGFYTFSEVMDSVYQKKIVIFCIFIDYYSDFKNNIIEEKYNNILAISELCSVRAKENNSKFYQLITNIDSYVQDIQTIEKNILQQQINK